jgi:(E)-4-hydroxy-3-methylbut-2-enyl-diphosphate synthase
MSAMGTTGNGAARGTPGGVLGRRLTRQVRIGGVTVGGGAPIRVQSMCSTDTRDIPATMAQIEPLVQAGCEIIRLAVPHRAAARAFGLIKQRCPIPMVADIHFDYELALAAIDEGADKVRINPGNVYQKAGRKGVESVIRKAAAAGIPIRIGVNSGSIEEPLLAKYGYPTPEAAVESALGYVRTFEELGFTDIVISVKFSEVPYMIRAYQLLSEAVDYPLHLGVTESGTTFGGSIKSAIGIGTLLYQGIGDTVRVSLTTNDKTEEVRAAYEMLKALELRTHGPMLTSCPGCGRAEVDQVGLTMQIARALEGSKKSVRVAVMGCVVNGPGEAREADIAVFAGRGVGVIVRRGKILRRVKEAEIVPALLAEVERWDAAAAEQEAEHQLTVVAAPRGLTP